jgi:phage repressor protein C with HTH and peptisase S24 domain
LALTLPGVGQRAPRAHGKRVKKFGQLLRSLRESKLGKRTSYEQVSAQLADRGFQLSASAIHRYESEGRVPDVLAVVALAELYRAPEDWLLAALRADLKGERLPASPDPSSASPITLEDDEAEQFVAVEILDDKIAAGPPLTIDEADIAGHLAFSKRWLDRNGVTRPLCVEVGRRERSMMGTINPGETVLLDCSDERRLAPKTDRIYAINLEGGSTLKRVIVVPQGLLLVSDNPDKSEYPTRPVELQEGQSILDVIVGEVIWKGQRL